VHTLYFWKDPAAHLLEIRRVLRPGGRLALGFRTKDEGSGAEAFPDAVYMFRGVDTVRELLHASGFRGEAVPDASGTGAGMVVLVAERGPAA
jgi:SAM-dependent methyltransferase